MGLNMSYRQYRNISVALLISIVVSVVSLLAAYKYIAHLADQNNEWEISQVKQSFSESVKSTETIAKSLQGLMLAISDDAEEKFQAVTAGYIASYRFIKTISYYKR